ncbi:hypothetical protein ACFZCL_04050 [Streptomyces sp. NPDC008159]|uniref:hypothetical protein n=1 Tax=Streptomyces sp. NPDC008159 TaxID=3364817 RepID=UPI0036E33897
MKWVSRIVNRMPFFGIFFPSVAIVTGVFAFLSEPDVLADSGFSIVTILLAFVGNVFVLVVEIKDLRKRRSSNPRSAARVISLAAFIAGQRRAKRSEWTAHLAGAPEQGVILTESQKRRLVAQFLLAAIRMRIHDMAQPVWRPVDWVLHTQSRTNGFITAVIGAQAIYIVGDGGVGALVTEVWEPCGIAGTALYVLSRWLRRRRGIELATPEPERTNE